MYPALTVTEPPLVDAAMSALLQQCKAILGRGGVLTGADVMQRPGSWGQGPCQASAILRPRDTSQLSTILQLCHAAWQPVVTHGGKTGKVDGCLAAATDYVVSLERMHRILTLDSTTRTLTVEAGATLQQAQNAASSAGLLLPLDLGARGSATIGGNIATNAGGTKVLRYGMMRQHVLGLEAVLADGTIISSLDTMLKNNAGYDLKQLFIGTEGTLGIVTRAVLKLAPPTQSQNTALIACTSLPQAQTLLSTLHKELRGQLSAFEVMWQDYYILATASEQGQRPPPLSPTHPLYVLIEAEGYNDNADALHFEQILAAACTDGVLIDAVVARSLKERDELWAIRENTGAYLAWQPVFSYDISLNLNDIEAYLNTIQQRIKARWPTARIAMFGHLGDGNIHLAIAIEDGSNAAHHTLNELLYQELSRVNGSISAEHGIGLTRRNYLHYSRSPEEIALMSTLKRALDPRGILNPGKVINPRNTINPGNVMPGANG